MSNILDILKFAGERGSEYLKKGNPFGKISDIVSTDKLRKQWNRTKNITVGTGAALLSAKLLAAKAAASAAPAVESVSPVVESAGAKTGGLFSKDWLMKQGVKRGIQGLTSGMQPMQDEEESQRQARIQMWNDYFAKKRMQQYRRY